MAGETLADARTGRNGRHALVGLLRQSVFGRLAGYEDVNDADRLRYDPAMRWIVGGKAAQGSAASPSQMGRFETQWLAAPANFSSLTDLSGYWIDLVHGRRPPRGIVLDMEVFAISPGFPGDVMSFSDRQPGADAALIFPATFLDRPTPPAGQPARSDLRVRPALKAKLETLAKRDRRTLSAYVEKLLEDHVKRRFSGRCRTPEKGQAKKRCLGKMVNPAKDSPSRLISEQPRKH
jgi:hypothetical protein